MGSVWLNDLPDALATAGVDFRTWPGWETNSRSSGGLSALMAIGVHHDASPTHWTDDDGCRYHFDNADIAPIGSLHLGRSGLWTVGAAGATNTQGTGGPVTTSKGVIPEGNGNYWFLSIEAANNGVGEPWPDVQIESYVAGVAGLMSWYNFEPGDILAHFEWTNPGQSIYVSPFRKIDPAGPGRFGVPDAVYPDMFNMGAFRADVWLRSHLEPEPEPAPEPEPEPEPEHPSMLTPGLYLPQMPDVSDRTNLNNPPWFYKNEAGVWTYADSTTSEEVSGSSTLNVEQYSWVFRQVFPGETLTVS